MSKAMQEKDSLPDVLLSTLLAGTVIDSDKKEIGGLVDAIVRLRSGDYPILSGLVLRVGANNVFLPITDVVAINGDQVEIRKSDLGGTHTRGVALHGDADCRVCTSRHDRCGFARLLNYPPSRHPSA